MRVWHGIESFEAEQAAPSAAQEHPARLSEQCPAFRLYRPMDERPVTLYCDKRKDHDDPLSEIGSVRRDPIHQTSEEVDGVTVTYTWHSERTI